MSNHVLVPIDGSPQSETAFEYALDEHPDAKISVIHVIDPIEASYRAEASIPGYSEEWYEHATETAEEVFEWAEERAAERGIEITTAFEIGRPPRTIIEYAEENDVDHIVVGSHGRRGVARILLGSVAEAVVRRSPIPVTVVR